MTNETRNILRAFLYGVTGAGLFRRLDYPGAPQQFVDHGDLAEMNRSGEFDADVLFYGAELDKQRGEIGRQRTHEEEVAASHH